LNRERLPVPQGFRLAIDADVRRPSWRIVVGGSPLRVLRLGNAGARLLDGWEAGRTVGGSRSEGLFARRLVDSGIAHPRPAGAVPVDVSVVIPVRDNQAGLFSTLASLEGLSVAVVDDGSLEPVSVRSCPNAEVKVIRERVSRGPAAARNAGWREVDSEVVVFIDADCVPVGDWLGTLLAHFADPAVGAVAPRIVSPAAGAGALGAYESVRSSLDLGDRSAAVRPGSRVPYVPTACLAVRRRALEEAGGFDESLRFGEDVDLVWRLHDAGWSVRFEPSASVQHPPRPDMRAWLRQRFDYGRSAAPLAARHGGDVAPLAVSPWSVGAWTLVMAGEPLAGAAVVAATAAVLARRARGDEDAGAELARLAVRGNMLAGLRIAEAVRRAWLPFLLLAIALLPPGRSRRRVALFAGAAFAAPVADWVAERPPVGPAKWLALRAADDLAYQAGLWAGALAERSLEALMPRF
jgi:mycofactocin system glycosyltransferase